MIAHQQPRSPAVPLRRADLATVDDAIVAAVDPLAVNARVAAAMLSVSERTLHDLTHPKGPIRCVRLRQQRLFPIAELRRWLEHETERASTDTASA